MIEDDIAYLRITQFSGTTVDEVREAAQVFEQNDYQSMIIDVRSNPGGTLDGVIDVADLFFESGTIVGTQLRDVSQNERYLATQGLVFPTDLPIVVLVDEGSASAAEILAGALQDRNRGYLIGTKTYGKGSVQWIRSLGDTGFKLTAAKYYLPSGRLIDGVGVEPDKVVEAPSLTDEEEEVYAQLRLSESVPDWVADNLDATADEIGAFIQTLKAEGFDLPDRWLQLMIRSELNVQNDIDQIYDLEFDVVLQEGVRLLQNGDVAVR